MNERLVNLGKGVLKEMTKPETIRTAKILTLALITGALPMFCVPLVDAMDIMGRKFRKRVNLNEILGK